MANDNPHMRNKVMFDTHMLTNSKIMMVKRKIAEHHGRVEDIKIFNIDPGPFWKEEKDRKEAEAEEIRERKRKIAAGEEVPETEEEKKDEEDEAPKQ